MENNNSTLGLLLDTGVDVPISGVFGDESSNVLLHEGVLVFSVRGESRVLWTGVPVASVAWLSIVERIAYLAQAYHFRQKSES